MSLHVYCPTETAFLLLAVRDERGLLRFPDESHDGTPGLKIDVKARLPIDEQLVAAAAKTLDVSAVRLDIVQDFADEMPLGTTTATLYLAEAVGVAPASAAWPTLPDILRKMAKDRRRLPYLRAWQVMTGGLKLNTKAVDVAELDPTTLKGLFET